MLYIRLFHKVLKCITSLNFNLIETITIKKIRKKKKVFKIRLLL